MKAITICQPYAALICLPDDDDRAKRVENRTWPSSHRGPLLIHAGKSRKFLSDDNYGIAVEDMDFGAIVGICQLRDCVTLEMRPGWSSGRVPPPSSNRYPWLQMHEHTEGPVCWVLAECRRFETPIPYKGAQGIFQVPNNVVAEQLTRLTRNT